MRYLLALAIILSFGIAEAAKLVALEIIPATSTISIDQGMNVMAVARYSNGEEMEYIDGIVCDNGTVSYGSYVPDWPGKAVFKTVLDGVIATKTIMVTEAGNNLVADVITSTVTITASSTGGIATVTIPSKPYIIRVDISPPDAVINAGDSMSFFATLYYNTGKTADIASGFVCDLGTFTSNIFSSSRVGRASITLDCNGVTGQALISVLPAPPHRLKIDMVDTFDYGYIYPLVGLVNYSLYDKYDNLIELDKSKVSHQIQKNSRGILGMQLGAGAATNPILKAIAPIIKTGYVADGNNIMFFERGSYTVTANYGNVVATKVVDVDFAAPFSDVEAWKDYRINRIDFEKATIEIVYAVMPDKVETIQIPDHFLNKFYEGSFMDKFQVICTGHYLVLQRRAEVIKEANRLQMNGLLRLLLKDGIAK